MSLIYDKYPGEWHGNKSISLVFQSLNRLYTPLENFEMCVFGSDTIFLDKIKRAGERIPGNWLKDKMQKLQKLPEDKQDHVMIVNALFQHLVPGVQQNKS